MAVESHPLHQSLNLIYNDVFNGGDGDGDVAMVMIVAMVIVMAMVMVMVMVMVMAMWPGDRGSFQPTL